MPQETLRVVFDCNVFWKAFFSRTGAGYWCYRLITDGKVVRHFFSPTTVDELIEVLSREETLEKFPEYDSDDVGEFVRYVVSISKLVRNVPHQVELPRDKDDESYLDLAVAVDADYLVTSDKDLLDLMTRIDTESKQFRQRFRHLKIVRPDEFLKIIFETGLSLEP